MKIPVIWLDEVDSTNTYALDNLSKLPDKALIFADSQTAGRGRRGRTWLSPRGVNIYASFVVKNPSFPVYCAAWIGGLTALEALREYVPFLDFWLKWPNDVYCRNRKIAGVLCESRTCSGGNPKGIVIGIGINLNMAKDVLDTIDRPATSVFVETGRQVDLKEFAALLTKKISRCYSIVHLSGTERFYKRWKKENRLLGKDIEFMLDNGDILNGKVSDFGHSGEIILLSDNGRIHSFHSGETSLIP